MLPPHSPFSPLLPTAVLVLVAALAIATVPHCRRRTARRSHHHHCCRPCHHRCRDIQLSSPLFSLLPRLPCHRSRSCPCHVASALAAVVAAALPNPGPCCCCLHCRCCRATPVVAATNAAIPRCCHHIAPALATPAVILAAAELPPLLLTPPLKLIFWLIVIFPQPLTLSPLVALSCCH